MVAKRLIACGRGCRCRPRGKSRIVIKKLTDEHIGKITNNLCDDIKVSSESIGLMELNDLERICEALCENTSTERLDLQDCGMLHSCF